MTSSGPQIHADSEVRRQRRIAQAAARPSALVLIDLQNDYCHADGAFAQSGLRVAELPGLVSVTNELLAAARAGGRAIIWTRTIWDGDADLGLLGRRSPFLTGGPLRRGSWGAQLLDGLDVQPSADVIVDKQRFDAFHQTELEAVLAARGIGTLVVGGVRTDFCVESTVRAAFFRDLDVLVARDAVAGYVPALHDGSLAVMNTVFAQVIDASAALAFLREPSTEAAAAAVADDKESP
jgi:nicotinamidase-related amidase